MDNKIKDFFMKYVGYIVVFLACAIYILTALLTIDKTGKTVTRIIADGAISFCLGLLINRMFDLQGLMSGDKEESVQTAKGDHEKIVLRISSKIDKLDDWCRKENDKNYKMQRTKILARAGLKYDDCFDENGVAKDRKPDERNKNNPMLWREEKKKMKAVERATSLKLTVITASELTSEGGKQSDPFYLGKTKAQFERERNIRDIISKLFTAVIFGYYGVTLIEDFSYANLIWQALQVVLFLVMGVISMYSSHTFMTFDYRSRIIKKTDILQKFDNAVADEQGGQESDINGK